MNLELKLSDLLKAIEDNYEIRGDSNRVIRGFSNLSNARKDDLSFVQSRKHRRGAATTKAAVLIIPENEVLEIADGITTIAVENPSRVLSQICGKVEALLYPIRSQGLHPSALIDDGADLKESVSVGAFSTVGASSSIGANTSIGARVSIGVDCHIGNNVRIADNCVIGDHTTIGDFCNIHSGVVVGTPGFGYEFNPSTGCHDPIPQVGRVVIGNHVDIGANTTIDRARLGETSIGDGTKIDNQVQIAHNVKIGKHCILCAFVGISGTVNMGDYVVLAGQVGVADHVDIAPRGSSGGWFRSDA